MRSQIMSTMIEAKTFYTPEDLLRLPNSKNYGSSASTVRGIRRDAM
jgi:hypothetical protein